MTLYVDDVRHQFRRYVMCHMWASTVEELHFHAEALGLRRAWFQQPPKASLEHYDVTLTVKAKALQRGALLTDKYGPVEHVARLNLTSDEQIMRERGQTMLDQVARCRQMFALPADGILLRPATTLVG